MLMVVNEIRYILVALKMSIKSAIEYRASFVIETIFMIINNSVMVASWYIIFSNTGSANDVNMDVVLKLWSISAISYGVTYFIFGGVVNINRFYLDGEFDIYLNKPKNILSSILTSKCRFSACGDIIFGVIIAMFISKSFFEFLEYIFLGMYCMVFLLATEIIFRSLTAWIGDTETLTSNVVIGIFCNISTYPYEIFSAAIKVIAMTIIPVFYACYLPIEIIDKFSFTKLVIVIVMGIVFMAIALKIFKEAVKRYESGNNISMRM